MINIILYIGDCKYQYNDVYEYSINFNNCNVEIIITSDFIITEEYHSSQTINLSFPYKELKKVELLSS